MDVPALCLVVRASRPSRRRQHPPFRNPFYGSPTSFKSSLLSFKTQNELATHYINLKEQITPQCADKPGDLTNVTKVAVKISAFREGSPANLIFRH